MTRAGRSMTRQAAGGLTVGLLLAGGLTIGLLLAACGGASDAEEPSGPTAAHTHAPPAPAPAPAPEADVLPAPPVTQALIDYVLDCTAREFEWPKMMTWREFAAAFAAATASRIDPPAALQDYHAARLQRDQLYLAAIAAQPPDDPVDFPAVVRAVRVGAEIVYMAFDALPAHLQSLLSAAGCLARK